jgi:hypothetical protein
MADRVNLTHISLHGLEDGSAIDLKLTATEEFENAKVEVWLSTTADFVLPRVNVGTEENPNWIAERAKDGHVDHEKDDKITIIAETKNLVTGVNANVMSNVYGNFKAFKYQQGLGNDTYYKVYIDGELEGSGNIPSFTIE